MSNEEKLISDLDSAELSAEMLASMPSPELFPLLLVNMQERITQLELSNELLLARLRKLGVWTNG